MIYSAVDSFQPIDQGDIIEDCPALSIDATSWGASEVPDISSDRVRAYVLTQTCDLAQGKSKTVTVAVVLDATQLVAEGTIKAADIRGPIRAGRVFGWYFLPKCERLGLREAKHFADTYSRIGLPMPYETD